MDRPDTRQAWQTLLEHLPASVRRAPDVTATLLAHGSLDDDSPTHLALQMVEPALLIDKYARRPYVGLPFHTAEEYQNWWHLAPERTRAMLNPRGLAAALGAEQISLIFRELDEALQIQKVGITPRPEQLREGSWLRSRYQPRARLGSIPWSELPKGMSCPDCGWRGGGGQLLLVQHPTSNEQCLVCDDDDVVFEVFPHPWHVIEPVSRLYERLGWEGAQEISTSVLGSGFAVAEQILLEALEQRRDVLPEEDIDEWGRSALTLRTSQPLGRWGSTVWRFDFAYEGALLTSLCPLGTDVPQAARQRSDQQGLRQQRKSDSQIE